MNEADAPPPPLPGGRVLSDGTPLPDPWSAAPGGGPPGRGGGVSRRALLAWGGALAVGAAAGGYALTRDPGPAEGPAGEPLRPVAREPGAVDYAGARWVPASPANWRAARRPGDFLVDRVVVHVVQGSFETALDAFQDPHHAAAAHYVVREDGLVAQTVHEANIAYHAGNQGYNERSVGIEHAGWVGSPKSFTDAMYRASARLTATICRRYHIPADRRHVIGHIEVPGSDHTDPGPFWDWDRYMGLVQTVRA